MSKREFDINGWYEVKENPISKVGVFQYLGKNISPDLEPERIYNVYRPEESLNNPETINSFKLIPWIPRHEMLGNGFTPAENVGVEGTTGEQVFFRDGTLYGNIKVYGEKLAKMIEEGIKDLSLGFRCKWEIISGTSPDGQSYDVRQTEIRGNHLASVPYGRMGSSVAVMDSSVFALDESDLVKIEPNPDGENMELKELVELAVAQGKQIKTLVTAMDGMSQDMKDMKEKAADMEKDKEKTAEDKEAEEKKKAEEKEKSEAMDSAIASLTEEVKTLKSTAMDGDALMKAFAEKQNLASQVSGLVGAFDHADMDINGVARYGLEKMGVACDSGQELAMLKGILHARKEPTFTVDHGAAKDSAIEKPDSLKDLGI